MFDEENDIARIALNKSSSSTVKLDEQSFQLLVDPRSSTGIHTVKVTLSDLNSTSELYSFEIKIVRKVEKQSQGE